MLDALNKVSEEDIPAYDTDGDYIEKDFEYLVTTFGEWVKPDIDSVNNWLYENFTDDCIEEDHISMFRRYVESAVEFYKQNFDNTEMIYIDPEELIEELE